MRWISVFCLTCIFLCESFTLELRAQRSDSLLQAEAHQLMLQQNYFEAAIAFERIWFFSADPQTRMQANLNRAQALKQMNEFAKARRDLQRSAHLQQFPDLHQQVLYEMAFCDYMSGHYGSSAGLLRQREHFYPHTASQPESLLLFALAALRMEDWPLAQEKTLEMIMVADWDAQLTDSLLQLTMDVFCQCAVPVQLSVSKAERWSTFVPGAGQLYAGYPGKAMINAGSQLVSLGIAGFMGFNDLYISGFVLGLGMFQSFYFGGIRQAGYLAGQQNLQMMSEYKDYLQKYVFMIFNLSESNHER